MASKPTVQELTDALDNLTDCAVLAAHYLLESPPKSNAHEQALCARSVPAPLRGRCGTVMGSGT